LKHKKIVVTGGAGFLGSHVVKLLIDANNYVVVLDDFSNGKMFHLQSITENPNLKIIHGDITKKSDVELAFKDNEIVVHLAVLDLRQSIKQPEQVNEVIVNGTINCLESALKNNTELFLNCSSSEVYGSAGYVPMDEDHPLRPETPYAAAKVAQDMYVHSYGQTYGLPWATIRPFNMYGPNSHWQGFRGELIPKMIVRAMNRKPLVIFGDGRQTRDFVYVEDAAQAIISIAEMPSCFSRPINFCSGVETSIRKIAELICSYFDLDVDEFIVNHQSRPGDVLRHLGSNKAFNELIGLSANVNIEEGIQRTCSWFESLPFSPDELISQEILRNWE
jgi:UDP-glucose 4-epimerase